MIEVIYKEDTTEQETAQESFSMPRNVRQIGLANGDYRIYIEDYVYTFLCSLAEDEKPEGQGSVAVLTGEIQWTADMTCIFIKVPLQQTAWRLRQNILTFRKNSGRNCRRIRISIFRSRRSWDGFCTASDSNGDHGAFCESTSQTFRRKRS